MLIHSTKKVTGCPSLLSALMRSTVYYTVRPGASVIWALATLPFTTNDTPPPNLSFSLDPETKMLSHQCAVTLLWICELSLRPMPCLHTTKEDTHSYELSKPYIRDWWNNVVFIQIMHTYGDLKAVQFLLWLMTRSSFQISWRIITKKKNGPKPKIPYKLKQYVLNLFETYQTLSKQHCRKIQVICPQGSRWSYKGKVKWTAPLLSLYSNKTLDIVEPTHNPHIIHIRWPHPKKAFFPWPEVTALSHLKQQL